MYAAPCISTAVTSIRPRKDGFDVKLLSSRLKLDDMSLARPAVAQLVVSFSSGFSYSHELSSLFQHSVYSSVSMMMR